MNVAQEDELSNDKGRKMLRARILGVFAAAHRDRTKINRGDVTRQDLRVRQTRERIRLIPQYRDHTYSKPILLDQPIGGEHQVVQGNHPHRSQEYLHVGHHPKSNDKGLAQRLIYQIGQGRHRLIKAVQEVCRVKPVVDTNPRSEVPALQVPDRRDTERSNTERITPLLGATDIAPLSRPPGQPPASIVTAAEIPSAQRALHPQDVPSSRPITSSSSLVTPTPRPLLYPEPLIACDRCGESNIEYELHKNCSACNNGNFNLCLRCYRLGFGCLHWFGFGYAVWMNYERQGRLEGYPPNRPQPHTLTERRYLKPKAESIQLPDSETNRPLVTSDNPAKRFQAGNFCSNCSAFSNDCFWKCDACNEGEWGFYTKPRDQNIPTQHPSPRSTSTSLTSPDAYKPLAFSSTCSLCRYPIQPSSTRFHCLQCHDHASDICTPCYLKLVSSGRISPENRDKGWRRCLRGHRMIIVGFEDSARGQRRVVVKDRVGGCNLHEGGPVPEGDELWTWRDGRGGEASMLESKNVSARAGRAEAVAGKGALLPPILLADMPFLPSGVEDELEAEDVNGDW
ncbi:MAG: hypothetical protein FRX48_00514 [Lasallia pustulata]|uniref:Zinc finger, RING/FYVE/PHD-type n=1 Tax=Lasallia pustulata TaxID=136370 RepID=A0A5M8Q0W8_9LECA|nr:MAG: hypothetical protein FRX48_00514 [Lasallia pustulata]